MIKNHNTVSAKSTLQMARGSSAFRHKHDVQYIMQTSSGDKNSLIDIITPNNNNPNMIISQKNENSEVVGSSSVTPLMFTNEKQAMDNIQLKR